MKIFTIPTAFALCAAVTQAAPTAAEGLEARQGGYPYGPNANCTFYGPIGVEYERSVPLDSHQHFTGMCHPHLSQGHRPHTHQLDLKIQLLISYHCPLLKRNVLMWFIL